MTRRTLARAGIAALVAAASGCTYYSDGPPPGYGGPGQPYMQNALSALQAARQQLQLAAPDKGGHRVQALRLVDQAIAQTRMGIEFAEGE